MNHDSSKLKVNKKVLIVGVIVLIVALIFGVSFAIDSYQERQAIPSGANPTKPVEEPSAPAP